MSIKAGLLGLVASAGLCFATAASADAQFYLDGLGLDAVITTSSTLNAMGGYDILGVTGSVAGYGDIVGLVTNPDQPNQYTIGVGGGTNFTFDNVFFTGAEHFDGFGMVFLMSDGQYIDVWENSPGNYELFVGNWVEDRQGNIDIEVPEPSALALMGSGLLLAGFAGSRLKRKRKAAAI